MGIIESICKGMPMGGWTLEEVEAHAKTLDFELNRREFAHDQVYQILKNLFGASIPRSYR
ncbi:hypothetical protein C5167_033431 [Papaver somniferum]|uniref:Uncharacterized protein n=1 Tax=Papaver somniferum TaxID=3469 RepID=A0A4Y7KAA8_PAPSO|nr:hypothetical protein C5167_033431 [Papaver somniferum]